MLNKYVPAGQAYVVRKSNPSYDILWTDGLGNCIALGLIGRNKNTRGIEILFAHLTLHECNSAMYGGNSNMAVSDRVRDFVREHGHISVLSATNHVNNLAAREYMKNRFSLPSCPTVRCLGRPMSVDVSLRVFDFTMYACRPNEISIENNITAFPTMAGADTDTANLDRQNGGAVGYQIL